MASKAELLKKAADLGVTGLNDSSSIKDINAAIAAKEKPTAPNADNKAPSDRKPTPKGGKHVMLRNVKHEGVSYLKGERVTLDPKDAKLFADKGFIDAGSEDEQDAGNGSDNAGGGKGGDEGAGNQK